jgi:hypothetical protein
MPREISPFHSGEALTEKRMNIIRGEVLRGGRTRHADGDYIETNGANIITRNKQTLTLLAKILPIGAAPYIRPLGSLMVYTWQELLISGDGSIDTVDPDGLTGSAFEITGNKLVPNGALIQIHRYSHVPFDEPLWHFSWGGSQIYEGQLTSDLSSMFDDTANFDFTDYTNPQLSDQVIDFEHKRPDNTKIISGTKVTVGRQIIEQSGSLFPRSRFVLISYDCEGEQPE